MYKFIVGSMLTIAGLSVFSFITPTTKELATYQFIGFVIFCLGVFILIASSDDFKIVTKGKARQKS